MPSSASGSQGKDEVREEETTGTKRTASKANTDRDEEIIEEPEAKRLRESEHTSMHDVNNIEVCEFYSMPRIAPKAIGKYVNKSASFDINTHDSNGNPWDLLRLVLDKRLENM